MSPKEIAEKLRHWADNTWGPQRDAMYALAKELDPPKSQRPEPGTVVLFANEQIGITHNEGIGWVNWDGELKKMPWTSFDLAPRAVRILADDEVAVKRSQIQALLGEVGDAKK